MTHAPTPYSYGDKGAETRKTAAQTKVTSRVNIDTFFNNECYLPRHPCREVTFSETPDGITMTCDFFTAMLTRDDAYLLGRALCFVASKESNGLK